MKLSCTVHVGDVIRCGSGRWTSLNPPLSSKRYRFEKFFSTLHRPFLTTTRPEHPARSHSPANLNWRGCTFEAPYLLSPGRFDGRGNWTSLERPLCGSESGSSFLLSECGWINCAGRRVGTGDRMYPAAMWRVAKLAAKKNNFWRLVSAQRESYVPTRTHASRTRNCAIGSARRA
jgi:hypothetical protein